MWTTSASVGWGGAALAAGVLLSVAAAWAANGADACWGAPLASSVHLWAAAVALATVGPLSDAAASGAWLGARAAGLGGMALVGTALRLGLVSAMVAVALAHAVAPLGQRVVRSAQRPGPVPVQVGDAVLFEADGRVHRVGSDAVAVATWRAGALANGRAMAFDAPVSARFASHRPARRIELVERSTADVFAAAARTEVAGGEAAYERAVGFKRWVHPLALLVLPATIVPWGLGRRPFLALGVGAAGVALAQRLADAAAPWLGGLVVASVGPLTVVALGWWGWAAWRER